MRHHRHGLPGDMRPRARWNGGTSDYIDRSLSGEWPRLFQRSGAPTIDMYETDSEMVIEADVPGFGADSLTIQVTPETLTMRGRTEETRDQRRDGYLVKEREFGQFARTIRFPTDVDPDEAKASYRDGVLKVTIPKKRRGERSREIPIQRE